MPESSLNSRPRRAAALGLLLALLAAPLALAMTRAELYRASAPLPDRSEASQNAAFQEAMRIVVVRVTGRRSAAGDAALAPLITNARRYVQQYRASPDNQLAVSFDGPAIERWLAQNGQPLWGHERPSTVVWLAVQGGGVITAADTSELKAAIDAQAQLRGVPLIWPSAADVERNHADYSSLSPGALAAPSKRLGAEGLLIGRASNATAAASVRWTLQFQDRNSEFSGALEGIDRTADLYAELFAASGTVAPLDIEVTGIGALKDYAELQAYLESLGSISHLGVIGLSGDTLRLRLATRAGPEALQRTLSLSGRLQPIDPGEGGVRRFQWH